MHIVNIKINYLKIVQSNLVCVGCVRQSVTAKEIKSQLECGIATHGDFNMMREI